MSRGLSENLRGPVNGASSKFDLVTWLAGAVLALFFIFPQIPLQIRYFLPITVGLLFLRLDVIRQKIFWILAAYFAYVTAIGLMVVFFTGDGSVPDALFGIKSAALCTIILVFSCRARPSDYGLLAAIAVAGGALGMVLDSRFGPIYSKLPFPIFSARDQLIRGSMELTSERFGGFTFEAGVAGGLAAIFMLLAAAVLYLAFCDRRIKLPPFIVAILVAGIVCGLITIGLSKTKTSLMILLAAAIALSLAILVGGPRAGPWWAKTAVVAAMCTVLASLPVAYKAVENTGMGEYIRKEMDNFYLLATRGFDRSEGLGLNTRIECAKKAIYALPFRPTGAGYTSGEFYVKPILDKIDATPEMEFFHNQGVYDGYKSAILNMMGVGGVVALAFLWFLMSGVYRGLVRSNLVGGAPAGAILVAGVLALGAAAELLPFLEICLLFWCFAQSGVAGVVRNVAPSPAPRQIDGRSTP
jgi:hypothetical protein